MLVFQLLAIPLAVLLFLWGAVRFFLGDRPRWIALSRPLLWLAAAVAVWRPDLTTMMGFMRAAARAADRNLRAWFRPSMYSKMPVVKRLFFLVT